MYLWPKELVWTRVPVLVTQSVPVSAFVGPHCLVLGVVGLRWPALAFVRWRSGRNIMINDVRRWSQIRQIPRAGVINLKFRLIILVI